MRFLPAISFGVLGKRIGVDVEYLVKNGTWVTLRYGVTAFLGLATTILFTRLTSPEVYGMYQFLISLGAFFSFLSLPGLNIAALRSVVLGNDRALLEAVRLSFLSSLFAIPCILAYSFYQDFFGARAIPFYLLGVVALFFPFFYAFNTWYVYYEGRKHFFSVTWRSIFISCATFCTLGIALLFQADIAILLLVYFGTPLFFSILFLVEIASRRKTRRVLLETEGRLDIRYGIAVTGQKFLYGFAETVPILLVGITYGYSDLAFFQIAFFIFTTVSGYIGALSALYLPKFFEGISLGSGKAVFYNIVSGILAVVGVSFFLFFSPFLYSGDYEKSLVLAWYFVPLVTVLPLKNYLLGYFTAQKRNTFLNLILLLAHCLSLGVFVFLRSDGLTAAVIGYIATVNLAITLLLLLLYFRQEKLESKDTTFRVS